MAANVGEAQTSKWDSDLFTIPEYPPLAGSGKWLIAIVFAAVAARFTNLAFFVGGDAWFLVPDSAIYLELRDNILDTGRFTREDGQGGFVAEIERVPGYPIFLAGLSFLGVRSAAEIVWAQAILDTATVALIALLGFRAHPLVGIVSGWLAALWPNLIITSALVLNDTLFLMLFSATLLCFAHYLGKPSFRLAFVGGLFFGISLMVRPVFQFLPPILLCIAYLSARHYSFGRSTCAGMAAVLLIGVIIPVAPISYRNFVEFETFSLSSQGGTHLLGWVLPLVKWHSEGQNYDQAYQEANRKFESYLAAKNIDPLTLSSFEASKYKSRFVLKELQTTPMPALVEAWAKGAIVNLGAPALATDPRLRANLASSFMESDGTGLFNRLLLWLQAPNGWTVAILLVGLLGSFLVSVLQLVGLVSLWPMARWGVVIGCLLMVYVLLIMGPVVGPKYRLPFAAVEIVLTAASLHWMIARARRRVSD